MEDDELDYEDWNNRSMTRSCGNINSVYTKILNSTQSNKIKKLVGEKNSDLDVFLFLAKNLRANFSSESAGAHRSAVRKRGW